MAHDKRSSLRRILTARVVILGAWLTIAAVSAVVLAVVAATHPAEQTGRPTGASPTRAERLVARHRCWTGPMPGVIPGHAVVTLPGRPARLVDSAVGFAIWLGPDGSPKTGDERDGIVHAFCR